MRARAAGGKTQLYNNKFYSFVLFSNFFYIKVHYKRKGPSCSKGKGTLFKCLVDLALEH